MILFCEYVVLHDCREAYLKWMNERLSEGLPMQALENTAQPGVFVEIWQITDADHAARIEKERREGRSWEKMTLWIKGGEAGLRIWTFRPVEAVNG
ncbi:hypothetical protein [Cohnella panacarvi]|uniref:hypothetical protein n=1 Tax=Cohnella panacarvi TaxID=400776 RepID=UPI0004BB24CB|nr:hypothetical protein [Cohnella panacarvi]